MIATTRLEVGDLTFTARCDGPADGELVIFLHGFPDNAQTFDHQLRALADAGYRCYAPTMRGYEPSSQPSDNDYSLVALAADVVGWLDALGVERAHLVGHDWGAATAYLAAAKYGDRCRTVTTLAVPPLPRITSALRHVPRQMLLSWYMSWFQVPFVSDRSLRARNWALLRWFWRRWSPGLDAPASLIDTFEQPGVTASALAYYRQNATPPLLLGLRTNEATESSPSGAPMLIAHGDNDGCMDARLFDHAIVDDDHPHGVRHEVIRGTGHFLHIEAPERVTRLLLDWIRESEATLR